MATSSNNAQKVNRKLKYKELIEKGAKISETLENQDVLDSFNNIMELIDVCETVSTDYAQDGKIEHTADYLMDAAIIKMGHDLMGSTAEKMADNNFHEDEYVAAILDLISSNRDDKLLEISIDCCRTAQFQLSMLGTFSFESNGLNDTKTQKVKRERQTKTQLGAKKAPENITQIVKVDKGAEKINLMRLEIERICKERKTTSIPYYELIIDPDDYMSSIDYAFQLSFLIRDGIMGLARIDQEPHVVLKSASSRGQEENSTTVQTVVSIDPSIWKMGIKKYKIKAPLLRLNIEDEHNETDCTSETDD
ncbi:non-structural maintenance of chromosomes element 4 homolog A [Chironomus tepperi]|uniref:non-structural maintenance of chromosomes element 4 homolog A n=1 Tax=Chironomus tepperi TaxID=113505 RepID=UPI00391F564F